MSEVVLHFTRAGHVENIHRGAEQILNHLASYSKIYKQTIDFNS